MISGDKDSLMFDDKNKVDILQDKFASVLYVQRNETAIYQNYIHAQILSLKIY